MELGDQRSLHTAISKGRLSGNLVRPKNKLKTKKTIIQNQNLKKSIENTRSNGHLNAQQYINTAI